MDTAKLFRNGKSQAVRLPKEYALPGTEVYVRKVSGVVMLLPKSASPWGPFVSSLDKFSTDMLRQRPKQPKLDRREKIQ